MITFITGGARSGKSRIAMELASKYSSKAFIATAVPFDAEMKERIKRHKLERSKTFFTIEEPKKLSSAIASLPAGTKVVVIDCLTVWLSNLIHDNDIESDTCPQISDFLKAIKNPPCDIIIVSNEVGCGIVPENPLARNFRDIAGKLNQNVASIANNVILAVSGIPVEIKAKKRIRSQRKK